MIPRLNRIAPGFSEDRFLEVGEQIENLEDHSQELANYFILLRHNLEKAEEKVQFLTRWISALTDPNTALREIVDTLQQTQSCQQDAIDDLIKKFKSINLD